MQHLSRRFSGFVFLYIVIAETAYHLLLNFKYLFLADLPWNGSIFDFLSGNSRIIILLLFVAPLIVIALRRIPGGVLRFNTFSVTHLLYAIGITVCLFLFVRLFFSLFSRLLTSAAYPNDTHPYFAWSSFSIEPYIIIFYLILAFLQILIFQGAILSGFYQMKPLKACAFVGVLYALVQIGFSPLSILELVSLVVIGFVLCLISVKAGSVIPSMIAIFLYYFLIYIGFGDWLYIGCFSKLGVTENMFAFAFTIIAITAGGLLLNRMPQVTVSPKPIKLPSKRRLQQFFWQDSRSETAEGPSQQEPNAVSAKPPELTVYPNDSEKQQKNTGFKIGAIIIGVFILLNLCLSIYYYTAM